MHFAHNTHSIMNTHKTLLLVRILLSLTIVGAGLSGLVSCNSPLDNTPSESSYEKVFIYCGLGHNNLSSYMRTNLSDLEAGILPGLNDSRAIVAYCHNYGSSETYSANPDSSDFEPPVLLHIYRYQGKAQVDTLKVYSDRPNSAAPDNFKTALEDAVNLFPSEHYGMLFSSHATGWLPKCYISTGENADYAAALGLPIYTGQSSDSVSDPADYSPFPLTKSAGAFYYHNGYKLDKPSEIDLRDFAAAIPLKLDYIIFDACLMGNAESVWELKDKCNYLVVSPSEVLAQGMVYETLSWNLLSGSRAELETVCKEYFERYDVLSGYDRSATISLVDCSKIENLASVFAEIVSSNSENYKRYTQRDSIPSSRDERGGLSVSAYYQKVTNELNSRRSSIQGYFYDSKAYFYDLRSVAKHICTDEALLSELDAALEECILYHAETPAFFTTQLTDCCGLGVYLPHEDLKKLNAYYRKLDWNNATRLVE